VDRCPDIGADGPFLRILAPTRGVSVTAVTANYSQISKGIRAKAVSSKARSLSHEKVEIDRTCDRDASRYPNFCGVYG